MVILSEGELIVECPSCKEPEYYDKLYMRHGRYYCRRCMYRYMGCREP